MGAVLRSSNWARIFEGDKFPCKIEEGVFLGSFAAAKNKAVLDKLNITHILTVACSLSPPHPNDFVYKVISVMDNKDTDIRKYFDECFSFVDEAKEKGGSVLVHCFVGRSRSVSIVVAYLMKKHGMSVSEALEYVRNRRPEAAPNSGFISQLQDFDKSLRDKPRRLRAVLTPTIHKLLASYCFGDLNQGSSLSWNLLLWRVLVSLICLILIQWLLLSFIKIF
ncbi:hypothetical protein HS088_TW10G00197 [Tripterygium wilfordii]|uniref:Dual specificity protein phosphatase 1 n=1 Tax=Tripterygium wilfordii TaxID=458696 RepID=A0A7J7D4D8_TRIWF|nr:dual specificity protein phosphatase 1B-like [Tripterygium wilfordii]KAF5741202.1 hypothetical protein HS088_TW10G00197 [Tripterygium wilfordii]